MKRARLVVLCLAAALDLLAQTDVAELLEQKTLQEIRAKVEKHIDRSYLRSLQAPQGVKPVLKAWLELN